MESQPINTYIIQQHSKPMVMRIGHRGAMGYEPENTLKSFKKALKLNVDIIELDVHVCKSGELVVIHDEKVDRTTNGKGYVAEKTLKELRNLDAGSGEKIPTLVEVLNLIKKKAKINIELKGPKTAKPVYEVIEDFTKNKRCIYNDFIISSFYPSELKEFQKLNPKIKIGILIEKNPAPFIELAATSGADSINISMKFTNQELIKSAHNLGLKVYVWTVNSPKDIKRMKDMGVDAIFSNFPDRL